MSIWKDDEDRHYDVLSTSAVMNDSSMGDGEYLEKHVFGGNKAKKARDRYLAAPALKSLPLKEIEKALTYETVSAPEGSEEYLWQRSEDIGFCPLCQENISWDRGVVARHIARHPEVVAFQERARHDRARFAALVQRRNQYLERLETIKRDLGEVSGKLRAFDIAGLRQREKQLEELEELLGYP